MHIPAPNPDLLASESIPTEQFLWFWLYEKVSGDLCLRSRVVQ
jgi:hypothetical protein